MARAALLPQASLNVTDSVERINLEAFLGKKIPGISAARRAVSSFSGGAVVRRAGI